MGLDRQLETGLDDGSRYGVVATAGAQGGDRAFVVAVGVAQCVLGKLWVVEFGFGEIRHGDPWDATCLRGAAVTLRFSFARRRSAAMSGRSSVWCTMMPRMTAAVTATS